MHQQPVYAGNESYVTGVSDDLFARGVCLPSGSTLSQDDVARIAGLVRSALRG